MLRIITAATALTVLVACDSEGIDRVQDQVQPTTGSVTQEDGVNSGQTTSGESTSDESTSGESTSEGTDAVVSGGTTDTSTDTGGTVTVVNTDTDTGTATGTGTTDNTESTTTIDDSGVVVDTTSDSDGGDTSTAEDGNPEGGSATADVGIVNSDQGDRDTDAGSFSSGVDGDVIRVSSLATEATEYVCTSLSDQDNYSNITNVGDFILHNNAWRTFRAIDGHEWEQCIYTNNNGALAGWNYDWGNGRTGVNGAASASGDYYVRSYPELIYGVKDEFRTSAPQSETGLPVMLSQMPNFRIDYSYDGPQSGESRTVDASNNSNYPNGSTISGERNVAIESFFYETDSAGNCTPDIVTRGGGSNHTYEVMVWLDAGAERLPAGPNNFVANLTIRGVNYKVYTKDSDERYVAFVAQNPQTTGTIYWNDFTDWARENAHQVREQFGALSNTVQIQDDWCMANILVGTEIFWGAGRFDIIDWTITQSR